MSVKRKQIGGGGGHGGAWIITFADLVSLLMAFFVMIVSFSTQEQEKVAHAAGSIREAFGVQRLERPAGMIEREGIPVREHARSIAAVSSEQKAEFAAERNDGADIQGPEANTHR